MNIKERWLLDTTCHSFIVEIEVVIDIGYGHGKIVQLIHKNAGCSLNIDVGNEFDVIAGAYWSCLEGQDAP